MVDSEFDQIWQRLEADRKEGRLDEDDKDKDEETLRAEYRAIAERRVRLGLLLAEIGRVNSITVSPDEMMRAMQAEAARYPGQEAAGDGVLPQEPAGGRHAARADLRGQGDRFRAGTGEDDRAGGHRRGAGEGPRGRLTRRSGEPAAAGAAGAYAACAERSPPGHVTRMRGCRTRPLILCTAAGAGAHRLMYGASATRR